MHRMIYRKGLADSGGILRIRVVPACLFFYQLESVRSIAVNLIRRHMNERRVRTNIPNGLEKIQRADRVDIEIVERPRCGEVVAWLCGRMNNCSRGDRANRVRHS